MDVVASHFGDGKVGKTTGVTWLMELLGEPIPEHMQNNDRTTISQYPINFRLPNPTVIKPGFSDKDYLTVNIAGNMMDIRLYTYDMIGQANSPRQHMENFTASQMSSIYNCVAASNNIGTIDSLTKNWLPMVHGTVPMEDDNHKRFYQHFWPHRKVDTAKYTLYYNYAKPKKGENPSEVDLEAIVNLGDLSSLARILKFAYNPVEFYTLNSNNTAIDKPLDENHPNAVKKTIKFSYLQVGDTLTGEIFLAMKPEGILKEVIPVNSLGGLTLAIMDGIGENNLGENSKEVYLKVKKAETLTTKEMQELGVV